MENLVAHLRKGSSALPTLNTTSSPLQIHLAKTFAGKKVFVTGHTGFKGSWLCEWLLLLGANVTGFSLPGSVSSPNLFDQLGLSSRLKDIRGDIRDARAIRDALVGCAPDFVFHLAAQPLVRISYRDPAETWQTNVLGTVNVLEALRTLQNQMPERASSETSPLMARAQPVVAVMVTTDKCYENREWVHGYREEDALGGHDPYSSSKAACEIAISSWRRSFFTDQRVEIASARAGNVIGGGDWAADRIVPDCIRALQKGQQIPVRNKNSTRPWQHVLEPLSGYLLLASQLSSISNLQTSASSAAAFNFGPDLASNRTVEQLVQEVLKHFPGKWVDRTNPRAPHEAGKLNLATDKAFHLLGWRPRWRFPTTIEKTVSWYRTSASGRDASELTRRQIQEYSEQ